MIRLTHQADTDGRHTLCGKTISEAASQAIKGIIHHPKQEVFPCPQCEETRRVALHIRIKFLPRWEAQFNGQRQSS